MEVRNTMKQSRRKIKKLADRLLESSNSVMVRADGSIDIGEKVSGELPKILEAGIRCKNDYTDYRLIENAIAMRMMRKYMKFPTIMWLDLGCGDGQLIESSNRLFGPDQACIEYDGIDYNKNHIEKLRAKQTNAECSNMKINGHVLELDRLNPLDIHDPLAVKKYHWVSLVNVIHEVPPVQLPNLLLTALVCCNEKGILYLRDFEKLPKLETDAIIWDAMEVEKIFREVLGFKEIICCHEQLRPKTGDNIPTYSIFASPEEINANYSSKTFLRAKLKELTKFIKNAIDEKWKKERTKGAELMKPQVEGKKMDFTGMITNYVNTHALSNARDALQK